METKQTIETVTVDVFGLIKFIKTHLVTNLNAYKKNKDNYDDAGYKIFQILDYEGHYNYEAYYIIKHVLNKYTNISAERKYSNVLFDNEQIKMVFDNAVKEACRRWTRRDQYHGPSPYQHDLCDNKFIIDIKCRIGYWIYIYSTTLSE